MRRTIRTSPSLRQCRPGTADWASLLLFALVSVMGILALVLWQGIRFARPAAFGAGLILPWFWWLQAGGRGRLGRLRRHIALWTRLSMVLIVILALAEPRAERETDDLAVVYAVDVSESVGAGAVDRALSYVTRTASQKPEHDRAGLVVFGREAAVELACREVFPLEALNSRVTRDATDLGRALSMAATLIPGELSGRVVLVSDGTQTDGSWRSALGELQARRIPVDVLPVSYEHSAEVWLERIDLPASVRTGETYEASVLLSSIGAGRGTLVLMENEHRVWQEEIGFGPGKQRITVPFRLDQPGYYRYVAQLFPEPGSDALDANNVACADLFLEGPGRILVFTDPEGDARDARWLVAALEDSGMDVLVADPFSCPASALPFQAYDCVVLVNVPADAFDRTQMRALRDAVYGVGTGLLMVGGDRSLGAGGYQRTAVEEALPVHMDIEQRRVMPRGALAVVLHTCEFAAGNSWGKRIAKEAIRVLGAQDEAGVLAYSFTGQETWVFEPMPVARYDEMAQLINQADIGDMPSFANTMQMALNALQRSTAAAKHVVIISDGDPQPPSPQLLSDFAVSKISVSTVAISPHTPQDLLVMQRIAGATGGRYYNPATPEELPAIFIKEATTLRRSLIQEGAFAPEQGFPSPILKGITAVPPLRGLVLSTPKARAGVVLQAPNEDEIDPVLAVWRYGLGSAGVFASDLSAKWGESWVQWDGYVPFVTQLLRNLSRAETDDSLGLVVRATGTDAVLEVTDLRPDGGGLLSVEARVLGPGERVELVHLRPVGPRHCEGRFPLWGLGTYQVIVAGSDGDWTGQALGGLTVPYSPEYLRFRSSPAVLQRIAEETGGRVLSGDEQGPDLYPAEREARRTSQAVHAVLLALLAFLMPIDAGVRRVQLDWDGIIRRFRRGEAPRTATLGALLARRDAVVERDTGSRGGVTVSPLVPERKPERPGGRASGDSRPEHAGGGEQARPHPPSGPTSTTGRLLERKRRRGSGRSGPEPPGANP